MRSHIKKHIDKNWRAKISCLHCPALFCSRGGHKNHHKLVHQDKSIDDCFCGKKLKSLDELKEHLQKVHNRSYEMGKKMIILTIIINSIIKTNLSLVAQDGIPPTEAERAKYSLLKRFSCLHCLKVFYSREDRQSHHKRVHKDKGLNDCFCGYKFETADKLKDHLKNDHKMSDENGKKPFLNLL